MGLSKKLMFAIPLALIIALSLHSTPVKALNLYYEYFDTADQALPFNGWVTNTQTPASVIENNALKVIHTSSGCPVPEAYRTTNNTETLNSTVSWTFNWTGTQPRNPNIFYLQGTNRKFYYGAQAGLGNAQWAYHSTDGSTIAYSKAVGTFSIGSEYHFRVSMKEAPDIQNTNMSFEFWGNGTAEGSGAYNETILNFTLNSANDAIDSMGWNTDACPENFDVYFDNVEINQTDQAPTNTAPTVNFYDIVPSTSSVGYEPNASSQLDANFSANDTEGDSFNASITWWENVSDTISPINTYDYVFTNITGDNITAAGQGSVTETLFKNNQWWATIKVDDGSLSSVVNTSRVTVQNTAPVFIGVDVTPSFSTNGTNVLTNTILDCNFTISDLDGDDNNVSVTWWKNSSSNVLSHVTTYDHDFLNVTGGYNQTSNGSSVSETLSVGDVWWCEAKVMDNDAGMSIQNSSQADVMNSNPVLGSVATLGTDGNTDYFFGEYVDYINVIAIDLEDSSLTPYLYVRDPEGTIVVNNQTMPLYFGNTYQYDPNIYLNAIGTWNFTIEVSDTNGGGAYTEGTFFVDSVNKTVDPSIYGWNYQGIPDNNSIDLDIASYGWKYVEIEFDPSNTSASDWAAIKDRIAHTGADSGLAILTMDDNLQNDSGRMFVAANYADLIAGYSTSILYLTVRVTGAQSSNTSNTAQLNLVLKEMLQDTNNKFPIKYDGYDSTVVSSYGKYTNINYIDTSTDADLIDAHASAMSNGSINMIFQGNTDRGKAKDLHTDVVSKLRSAVRPSEYNLSNVAELNNLDIVVFNDQATQQTYGVDINESSIIGTDVYDFSNHRLVERANDGHIDVVIEPMTASVIYFEQLSKFVVTPNDGGNDINLFSSLLSNLQTEESYQGVTAQSGWNYFEGSTFNHYDGQIQLNDPNYKDMDFYIYYGSLQEPAVDNWSIYKTVVIGDTDEDTCNANFVADCSTYNSDSANCGISYTTIAGVNRNCVMPDPFGTAICQPRTLGLGSSMNGTQTGICSDGVYDDQGMVTKSLVNGTSTTEIYGYMAVDDYCNPSSWTYQDMQAWIAKKKAKIDSWTNIDQKLNLFIDGYDIGDAAVCDNSSISDMFVSSVESVADYARTTKGRKTIFNTYTQYQQVVHMADGIMKESCVSRWNNTVNDPVYDWEAFPIELDRYRYFTSFGVKVYCQSFGQQGDYEKAYYDFLAAKVLGYQYVSYNQPRFYYQYYNEINTMNATGGMGDNWNWIRYPDVGAPLESDLTDEGDGVYSRKYENGLIRINTTSHTGQFITDQSITGMQLCAWLKQQSSNHQGSTVFTENIDFNNRQGYLNDSQIPVDGNYHEVCTDLNPATFFEPSGYYNWKFFYKCFGDSCLAVPSNTIRTSYNASLYGGRRSGLDDGSACNEGHSGTNMQPDLCDATYLQHSGDWATNFDTRFQQGQLPKWYNFDVRMVINRSQSSLIDTMPDTAINRTEIGDELLSVQFNASSDFNISVYDKAMFVTLPLFNGIFVGGVPLNYSTDASCITTSPLYYPTLIGDDTWYSCYYDNPGPGYTVKVVVPHLSNETYTIDGNQYPVISLQNETLTGLTNEQAEWTLSFNTSDPFDGDVIGECGMYIDDLLVDGTYVDGLCSLTINTTLNSSYRTFQPFSSDQYGFNTTGSIDFGINYTFNQLVGDGTKISDLNNQWVFQRFDFNNPSSSTYYGVEWTLANENYSTIFDISPNAVTSADVEYRFHDSLLSQQAFTYAPTATNDYYVDQPYSVYTVLNLTYYNQSTLGQLPGLQLNVLTPYWTSSNTLSLALEGSGAIAYTNDSNLSISFNTSPMNDGDALYNASHDAFILYSDNTSVGYLQVGDSRYYSFGGFAGRNIYTLFPGLFANTNTLHYDLPFSELTSWSIADFGSNNLTDNSNNLISTTFLNDTTADVVYLAWTPDPGATSYLYNLQWRTTEVPENPGGGGSSTGVLNEIRQALSVGTGRSESLSTCDNGVCEPGENPLSCSADCPFTLARYQECLITNPDNCADSTWFLMVTIALVVGLGWYTTTYSFQKLKGKLGFKVKRKFR